MARDCISGVLPSGDRSARGFLFERRVGSGLQRAQRAAANYLAALDASGNLGLDEVNALLRVWSLARSVRDSSIDAEVRKRLAGIATSVMDVAPGAQPGVVLPMLRALAQGPISPPDPHDVDSLLARAASLFRRGDLATHQRARRPGGTASL